MEATSFQVVRREGTARRGELRSSSKLCATPACLLYTRKGSPQNMPVDLAASLVPALEALYLTAGDVYDQRVALERSQMSMNEYFGLSPAAMTFVAVRDPAAFNEASLAGTMAVAVTGGYAKLTAVDYAAMLRACAADFCVGPAYELPPTVSSKRMKKCLESASRWQKELLDAAPELRARLFAPLLVNCPLRDRRSVLDTMMAHTPFGYAVSGLTLGETVDQRQQWLAECLVTLPDKAPRLGVGISSPDDVVEAVQAGIDLFASTYPNEMAELGFALCFDLSPSPPFGAPHSNKLNMRDHAFALDATPLVAGCACYSCAHHTRAYIHHLLHTHEMLATILLILHNCSHYSAFFAAVRAHLDAGSFAAFADAFITTFRSADT